MVGITSGSNAIRKSASLRRGSKSTPRAAEPNISSRRTWKRRQARRSGGGGRRSRAAWVGFGLGCLIAQVGRGRVRGACVAGSGRWSQGIGTTDAHECTRMRPRGAGTWPSAGTNGGTRCLVFVSSPDLRDSGSQRETRRGAAWRTRRKKEATQKTPRAAKNTNAAPLAATWPTSLPRPAKRGEGGVSGFAPSRCMGCCLYISLCPPFRHAHEGGLPAHRPAPPRARDKEKNNPNAPRCHG